MADAEDDRAGMSRRPGRALRSVGLVSTRLDLANHNSWYYSAWSEWEADLRIFKTKVFARFARSMGISDAYLCEAVVRAGRGVGGRGFRRRHHQAAGGATRTRPVRRLSRAHRLSRQSALGVSVRLCQKRCAAMSMTTNLRRHRRSPRCGSTPTARRLRRRLAEGIIQEIGNGKQEKG